MIISFGIQDNVVIVGPLYNKDKLQAYVDADVCVLPSRYEIFGMTVIESIACGTPVIMTNNCGLAPDLSDRVGLVVKGNSPTDLEGALLETLTNMQKYFMFKKNCKKIAEKYDLLKQISNLETVLSSLI